MKSNAAKIIFIILVLAFAGGAYWFFTMGPAATANTEAKQKYSTFTKTEATITGKDSNGRVGKSERIYWNLQYNDQNQAPITARIEKREGSPFSVGNKITVYIDPKNPREVIDEEDYQNYTK